MAPQTHTRYRVQRLIRKGEWLERNGDALVAFFDALDSAHDELLEVQDMEAVSYVTGNMMAPIKALFHLTLELRHDSMCRGIQRGTDVTLHHPYACEGWGDPKEYESSSRLLSPRTFRHRKSLNVSAPKSTSPTDGSQKPLSRT